MSYCSEETDVDGETVECEKAPAHDGPHAGHVPEGDAAGLLWELYEW